MGVIASAPAKVILFGEHFVVYGEPTIVLAIDKRAYARVELSQDKRLYMHSVNARARTTGFCRICIPTALMNDTFRVFVNDTEILPSPEPLPCSNSTYSYLYFTYHHSTQEVVIVPEFPSFLILPLFLIATLLAVIVYKRKHTT